MKRTTIKISDELDAKLRHMAEQRGVTLSEVIREGLELYADNGLRRRFLSLGAGSSGQTGERPGIAERMEEILREEWTDPRDS